MRFYIDPGTGSMLFTILIAVLGSLVYLLRNLKLKIGDAFAFFPEFRKNIPDNIFIRDFCSGQHCFYALP